MGRPSNFEKECDREKIRQGLRKDKIMDMKAMLIEHDNKILIQGRMIREIQEQLNSHGIRIGSGGNLSYQKEEDCP